MNTLKRLPGMALRGAGIAVVALAATIVGLCVIVVSILGHFL
jgi:hypothetical protein